MKSIQFIYTTVVGLILLTYIQWTYCQQNDRVRLRDIQTLTLYADRLTTARRSQPISQLKCAGPPKYCSKVKINSAQCYNRGSNGRNIQWECKADMVGFKFLRLSVNCEGYENPQDEYVLAGSCGLEYTIEKIDRAAPESEGFSFMPIVVIIVGILMFYCCCLKNRNNQAATAPDGQGGQFPFFATGNAQPSAPPPPGFNPDIFGPQLPRGPIPSYQQQPFNIMGQQQPLRGGGSGGMFGGKSGGPGWGGLLGGMAAGGLGGYLFGRSMGNSSMPTSAMFPDESNTFSRNDSGMEDIPIESTGFAETSLR